MSGWNSGAADGTRIVDPVRLYAAAKGSGVLGAGDGLPDISCHSSVLRKVGLCMLPEDATVSWPIFRFFRHC